MNKVEQALIEYFQEYIQTLNFKQLLEGHEVTIQEFTVQNFPRNDKSGEPSILLVIRVGDHGCGLLELWEKPTRTFITVHDKASTKLFLQTVKEAV